MANEYALLADLKSALKISGSGEDTNLQNALTAASRQVDGYTRRRFWLDSGDTTRTYVPVSPYYLRTDDFATLTSVSDWSGTWTLTTDFSLAPENAAADGRAYDTLRSVAAFANPLPPEFWQEPTYPAPARRFSRGRPVTVTARFGWPTVPPEVQQATMILAAQIFQRPRQAVFGVVGLGFEGGGMRIPALDPTVARLLDPYRKSGMVE